MRVPVLSVFGACVVAAAAAQPASFNLSCLSAEQRAEAQSGASALFQAYSAKKNQARAAAVRQAQEERARRRDAMWDCDAAAVKAGSSASERCKAEMAAFRDAQRALDDAAAAGDSAVRALEAEEAAQMQALRARYPSC